MSVETPTLRTQATTVRLARSLSLLQVTLYGLGVTVGAGIYVLIGTAAAHAGMQAPLAFVVAAALMALSGASFAELAGRFPVAAGEAAYARAAFRSNRFATAVGLLVTAIAIVSAAAIAIGSAGYLSVFIPLPMPVLAAAIIVAMGGVAARGIKQSIVFAGAMTIIEIGGLVLLVVAGFASDTSVISRLPEILPSENGPALTGFVSTVLLAVFAFIGFEGISNVAEEVRDPKRTLPLAILLTLTISTVLYVAVVWTALVTVDRQTLMQSNAPLALVFQRLTGLSPHGMSLIAVLATLNGIVVQIIMASRVLYGLARLRELPAALGKVSPRTHTPLVATALATAAALVLALFLPLHDLAGLTSRITLVVFTVVNASLVILKLRSGPGLHGGYVAPVWAPWAGASACITLLAFDVWTLAAA
jgi:basic amino acid/polyamine antiporter, APA family